MSSKSARTVIDAKCMQEISSEMAFWVLDAWQRMARPLQVLGVKGSAAKVEPAKIYWVAPSDSKISVNMLNNGRAEEWRLSLADAKFSFCASVKSCPSSKSRNIFWRSHLLAELRGGKTLLFAEPIIPSECLASASE